MEEEVMEVQDTAVPENAEAPKGGNRQRMLDRMGEKYPDRQFTDDEELFGQINDDYDNYDQELNGYKEREGTFADMFTADPRSARLMMEWRNGGDPAVELVRIYGDDILEAVNDPDKQEEIKEANREFAERVAKEKDYEQQYEHNLQESLATLSDLQQSKGYSDEQIDSAMELIMQIAKDAMLGRFTPETLDMAFKALNYDGDVANAGFEGEVRGRNAKVDTQLKLRGRGDGTPQLDGSNNRPAPRNLPDMGALERFDGTSKNIWERGNERRITNS